MDFVSGWKPVDDVFQELLMLLVWLAVEESVVGFPGDELTSRGCPVEFLFEVVPVVRLCEGVVESCVEGCADHLIVDVDVYD